MSQKDQCFNDLAGRITPVNTFPLLFAVKYAMKGRTGCPTCEADAGDGVERINVR
jgi:hypothetical protein